MKNITYQQNAINELTDKTIRLLNLGGKRHKIVFEAPTGAGKTVMTCQALAYITDELKERGDSRSRRSTSYPASGCWGWGAAAARRRSSWKKPLQRSVPRPVSARRRSAQPPAST